MRICQVIFLTLFCIPVFSQQKTATVPAELAKEITSSYDSEYDKVRAIFEWITSNVEYQVRNVNRIKRPAPAFMEEDTGELKSLDERVAIQVMNNKSAVCDGYSRLFKTLCKYAGIEAELVTGYARTTGYRINERFKSNHTWNAVRINNEWKLLDVTWGSGYVSRKGDYFIQHINEEYFLPDPKHFISEHYPDDIRWTLLPDPPLLPEFHFSPYRQRSFAKYNISKVSPSKGIIEGRIGENITVELNTKDYYKDGQVYAEPFLDTSLYVTNNSTLLVPDSYRTNKIVYNYKITGTNIQWLYLLYHNDIILRYRLTVLTEGK